MDDLSGIIKKLTEENSMLKQRVRDLEESVAEHGSKNETRQEMEEHLKKNEERYKNILDNMEEAYYEVDLAGNLTFFNTTAAKNLGYTDDVMMGLNFCQYVDRENERKLTDAYSKVFRTGESVKGLDWELITKKSGTIPVESSITIMRNSEGKPEGFRGIIRDITARKQAENKLRESEEKYRLLAENAYDIIFTMDNTLRITYVSPSVTRFRGYTVEEAMKETAEDILAPASFEKAMRHFAEEMLIEADGTGDPDRIRTHELELNCKDGSTIWTEIVFTNMRNDKKEFLGFLGIAHDISGRKRAEEALLESEKKFRTFTETALDVIVTIDMDGIITYANPAARELAAGKDVTGLVLKDLLPPEFSDLQAVIFESVRQGFSDPLSYEMKINRPGDDHPLYFDVKTSTILNHGVMFVARDITERRQKEDEIRLMAVADNLTGLYNRRGFVTLAEQRLKLSVRENKNLLLFFIDLDRLKFINDTYGHEEGDCALKKTAAILRKTFRESDIIARLGGDEFAVLITDSDELPDVALKRLNEKIDEENLTSGLSYPISMSIGIAEYDSSAPCSIFELMSLADRLMYEQKQSKKNVRQI